MRFDIRLPIGLLFLVIGAILVWFGLTSDPAIYQARSLGLNVNLIWGACLAVFGVVMLGLVLTSKKGGGED